MGHDFLSVVCLLHCLHSLQIMAGPVPDILAVWNQLWAPAVFGGVHPSLPPPPWQLHFPSGAWIMPVQCLQSVMWFQYFMWVPDHVTLRLLAPFLGNISAWQILFFPMNLTPFSSKVPFFNHSTPLSHILIVSQFSTPRCLSQWKTVQVMWPSVSHHLCQLPQSSLLLSVVFVGLFLPRWHGGAGGRVCAHIPVP